MTPTEVKNCHSDLENLRTNLRQHVACQTLFFTKYELMKNKYKAPDTQKEKIMSLISILEKSVDQVRDSINDLKRSV